MRLRYADDPAAPRLARVGEARTVRIVLFPTANRFGSGHRVRLDVSSSNFPNVDVNSNTGEPEGRERRRKIATDMVFAGPSRLSRIDLPVRQV